MPLYDLDTAFKWKWLLAVRICAFTNQRTTRIRFQLWAAVNTAALAEAKKHLGQPYVWGAEGPKSFDCSGLVMYSYSKFHVSTPRVSSDQFKAALKIPASRAVPGDLVFYHDKFGDVYHVGIYLAPGQTVAAIDPAEGVDYQTIWDPHTATYGSFTHN